jgi:hypothetical protein
VCGLRGKKLISHPPGAAYKHPPPHTRHRPAAVGAAVELGLVAGLELGNALKSLLLIGDPLFDPRAHGSQDTRHAGTDGLIAGPQVRTRQGLNLRERQSQSSEVADHPDTPHSIVVKQAIVPGGASCRVDQTHVFILAKGLHGNSGPA